MADDKNLQGAQDRNKVAGNENYEVRYIAEKLGTSEDMVHLAIKEVGNSREAIEEFIKNMKHP